MAKWLPVSFPEEAAGIIKINPKYPSILICIHK